jgi:hypothetical protein
MRIREGVGGEHAEGDAAAPLRACGGGVGAGDVVFVVPWSRWRGGVAGKVVGGVEVDVPEADCRIQGAGEHVAGWGGAVGVFVPEGADVFFVRAGGVAPYERVLEAVVAGGCGAGSDAAGVVVFFCGRGEGGGYAFIEFEFGG